MELEAALTGEGFRVIGPAASVGDAIYLLSEECPDVAVLDFNLGREKVTPVALQLRALGVPFVLATATERSELALYEVLAEAPNLGKPADLRRLVESINGLARAGRG